MAMPAVRPASVRACAPSSPPPSHAERRKRKVIPANDEAVRQRPAHGCWVPHSRTAVRGNIRGIARRGGAIDDLLVSRHSRFRNSNPAKRSRGATETRSKFTTETRRTLRRKNGREARHQFLRDFRVSVVDLLLRVSAPPRVHFAGTHGTMLPNVSRRCRMKRMRQSLAKLSPDSPAHSRG